MEGIHGAQEMEKDGGPNPVVLTKEARTPSQDLFFTEVQKQSWHFSTCISDPPSWRRLVGVFLVVLDSLTSQGSGVENTSGELFLPGLG